MLLSVSPERQEVGSKFLVENCEVFKLLPAASLFVLKYFPTKKLMTQCHYSDHNLKMIIIIKAIIGFEISFWTEFFQIPQFDTGSGV